MEMFSFQFVVATVSEPEAEVAWRSKGRDTRCDTSRRKVTSSALLLRQVAEIRHLFGARSSFWKRGNVS